MTTEMGANQTAEQEHAQYLAGQITGLAGRLRRLAGNLDTEADGLLHPSRTIVSYSNIVSSIQNDLLWELANASLGSLTVQAARADDARIVAKQRAIPNEPVTYEACGCLTNQAGSHRGECPGI